MLENVMAACHSILVPFLAKRPIKGSVICVRCILLAAISIKILR